MLRARNATRKRGYENLLWVVADASRLPFRAGVFHAVRGADDLEIYRDVEDVPREVERVLRSRG